MRELTSPLKRTDLIHQYCSEREVRVAARIHCKPQLLRQRRRQSSNLIVRHSRHVVGIGAHEHRVVIRRMGSDRRVESLDPLGPVALAAP